MPRRALALALALSACAGPPGPVPQDISARRVVSQTVLSDEVLWALGPAARARVVGVSALADDPRYSDVADAWPAELPRRALTTEGLLALAPDLAIVASFTAPEVRAVLVAHGVRMLELDGFSGLADYRAHVRRIAAAVDAAPAGEALLADLDAALAELRARRPKQRLAAISWADGFSAGAGTTFDDVADAAGLSNLTAEQGLQGHAAVPLEQLVAWDPAVIVVSCPARAADDPACRDAEAAAAALPGVAATRAARTGRIVAVPARALASTGAGMITAASILQARLRPAEGPP